MVRWSIIIKTFLQPKSRLWNDLKIGDEIIIQGNKTGSIIQKVDSMQIEGEEIKTAEKGQNVGLLVKDKVRPNDVVYKRIPRKIR